MVVYTIKPVKKKFASGQSLFVRFSEYSINYTYNFYAKIA